MLTFLRWFCFTLAFGVASYFSFQYGIPQKIWVTDFTYMTSVISGIFIITIAYLGYASWRFDRDHVGPSQDQRILDARAATNLGRVAAYVVTLFGLLGTAIGLMYQVQAIGQIDPSQTASIQHLIASLGSSFGTALYATMTGILASVGITIITANLEHSTDVTDE